MIAKRQRFSAKCEYPGNTNHTRRQLARMDIRMANRFIVQTSFVCVPYRSLKLVTL